MGLIFPEEGSSSAPGVPWGPVWGRWTHMTARTGPSLMV